MTPFRLTTLGLLLLFASGSVLIAGFQPARDATESVSADVPIDDDARAEARWIYDTRCSYCHGDKGRGDGDGARDLEPGPGDFTRSRFVAESPSHQMEAIILQGGSSVGRSALMPPNPDLKAKPDVLVGLRDLVRELGAPRPAR